MHPCMIYYFKCLSYMYVLKISISGSTTDLHLYCSRWIDDIPSTCHCVSQLILVGELHLLKIMLSPWLCHCISLLGTHACSEFCPFWKTWSVRRFQFNTNTPKAPFIEMRSARRYQIRSPFSMKIRMQNLMVTQ